MSRETSTNDGQPPPRKTSRRGYLRTLALGSGVVVGTNAFSSRAAAQIPTEPTRYVVQMSGVSPNERFDRIAELLVTPPVDTTGSTINNETNVRDIALVSGNPSNVPEAGAIWYATNTALYKKVRVWATQDVIDAALDVAVVDADEEGSILQVVPNRPDDAPAAQQNTFNARTGILEGVFVVDEGIFQLDFNEDGTQFFGAMDFRGVPPAGGENGHSRLQANMLGVID